MLGRRSFSTGKESAVQNEEIGMPNSKQTYTQHRDIVACIQWAVENNQKVVYYPEGSFSLRGVDWLRLWRLRKALLGSETEVFSVPGASAMSDLLGDGENEYKIKLGMRYIPPKTFRESMNHAERKGTLRYLIEAATHVKPEIANV